MRATFQSVMLALLICHVLGGLASHRSCHADEYTPIGPPDTEALEMALVDRGTTGWGIWPRPEVLKRSKKADLDAAHTDWLETWFSRVLKESLLPESGDWKAKEWSRAPKLLGNSDFLLGHFASQDKRVARIEFQQEIKSSHHVDITIVSEKLFPNRQFSKEEIRKMFGELLNIPGEVVRNLEVEIEHASVGDDGTVLTYGRVFDMRKKDPAATELDESMTKEIAGGPPLSLSDPNAKFIRDYRPLIPYREREWFSPMAFWIAKGRLCLRVSTTDWKSGDRPM